MTRQRYKMILRTTAMIGAFMSMLILSAGLAQAHVSVDSAQPGSDGKTTLDFAFNHGCGVSPTTALIIEFPVASDPTPISAPTGWRSSIRSTEDSTKISWTGPAIPNGKKVVFAVSARLTGSPGQTVWFPTVQSCQNGKHYDWIQTAPTAEEPAPSVVLTAAMIPTTSDASRSGTTGSTNGSLWIALGAIAVLAVIAGSATYLYMRQDPTN